jgi:hypothetical protein
LKTLDKLVEASPLLQEVLCRGLGSFFFQSEMHTFVTAVLLWMAWLDPFDADSRAQPPNRQLAQVE